jgi:uncharacterized protein
MIIIHAVDTLPRLVGPALAARLRVMPAVVVTGARQTGKSTLVERLVAGRRRVATLDDYDTLAQARREPDVLLAGRDPITIDEVQRAPELLHAVKRAIDTNRKAGRFLLTGSANLLMMDRVAESPAGRASYLTLWPMTRREQLGLGSSGRWEELIATPDADWRELFIDARETRDDWRAQVMRGGYPTPALTLESHDDRRSWFDGYTRTYLERDLQALSSIAALPDFRRLMRAVCLRIGQLANQTELGRDVALPQPTVNRWLNLLETSYQLVRLPAFAVNRTKRLIKTPKLYWSDTGLANYLSGADELSGGMLENLVLCDLLAWRDARVEGAEVTYWRTASGDEVDFVLEVGRKVIPIEIKASAGKPRLADVRHLRAFRAEYGAKARAGLLLHAGTTVEWVTPDVLAVPWWGVV